MSRTLLWLVFTLGLSTAAAAQSDEIQVYDGGLAGPGVFNLTLHNNFVASGIDQRPFPGAVKADRSLDGFPEWALGVTRWMEVGLYLPVYSRDADLGWGIDGNQAARADRRS
jgi:hypothetical protein